MPLQPNSLSLMGGRRFCGENEELVIKPFLNKFSELVSKADKKRYTLFDFLYTPK